MVVQNIDYDSPGPPVIYPDMTGADLDRSMREHTMAVGVVYGAAHVPGIFRYLSRRYRYRVVRAEWMPVFNF
jgi:hypothetical protein